MSRRFERTSRNLRAILVVMKALDFKTNILATLQRRTFLDGEEGLGSLASSHDTNIAGEYAVKARRKVKIGSVLNRLMREHDFSIKELAFESGVPAGTISHLKNNRPVPLFC